MSLEDILLFTEVVDTNIKDKDIVTFTFLKNGVFLNIIEKIWYINYNTIKFRLITGFWKTANEIIGNLFQFVPVNCYIRS